MAAFDILFWVLFELVFIAYVGYPLLSGFLAWVYGRPLRPTQPVPRSVSIVLCAFNESTRIGNRLRELCTILDSSELEGEILLVSDGSTDDTVAVARALDRPYLRVIDLRERVGKAAALSRGVSLAQGEILIFADVRQTWPANSLDFLLAPFADPTVGAVTGDLVLENSPGVLAGVGLYWRFEKWLRRQESKLWSMVGATGAISAVRRSLFRPIPAGTLLDDVYWPLRVAMQGYRVWHEQRANAFDRLPPRAADEFRRKVRTLSGNFQLLGLLPSALLPWCNPIWFQFLCHKLLRLVVPWCLLALLPLCAVLAWASGSWFYGGLTAAQGLGYLAAMAGLHPSVARRSRIASASASFLLINSAAWIAFWVWILGRAGQTWTKTLYQSGDSSPPSPDSLSAGGLV
jgi:cellulose synthase/poly-beta-1,6-N-acetylglucosamine synthase-like glycosyltransferase